MILYSNFKALKVGCCQVCCPQTLYGRDIPSVFCDELVMFLDPGWEGWAPPRSSCGRCSPATAAARGSSRGTPERTNGVIIVRYYSLRYYSGGIKRWSALEYGCLHNFISSKPYWIFFALLLLLIRSHQSHAVLPALIENTRCMWVFSLTVLYFTALSSYSSCFCLKGHQNICGLKICLF